MYLYVYIIHIYFFRQKQHQNDARRSFAGLGRKAFFDLPWFSLEFIGSWDSAYLKGSQSEMGGLPPGGFNGEVQLSTQVLFESYFFFGYFFLNRWILYCILKVIIFL